MLRTIFLSAILVWIVGLGFRFGAAILPLLLVLTCALLAMAHMFHRRAFN